MSSNMPQDGNVKNVRNDTSAGNANHMSDAFQPSRMRVRLGSLGLDAVTFDEAVAWTLDYIANHREGPPARICSPECCDRRASR
jgi:hypothetical protein